MDTFEISQNDVYPSPSGEKAASPHALDQEGIVTYPPGENPPQSPAHSDTYTEHTGDDGHGDVGFPPLQSAHFPSQLFWLVISFSLLYVLLSRCLLPRVGAILEKRKDVLRTDFEKTQFLKTEAEQLSKACEEALLKARAEAHKIRTETRALCTRRVEEEKAKYQAFWSKKMQEEEARCVEWREKALKDQSALVTDLSEEIVARLVFLSCEKTMGNA